MSDQNFDVELSLLDGYQFAATFRDGIRGAWLVDESPPLGRGMGPNPTRLLGMAIGQCLASSMLFCLRKARIELEELEVKVEGTLTRNEHGRLRIGEVKVLLDPRFTPEQRERANRCLDLFEDFCIVTESVRSGFPVTVEVAQPTAQPAPV